MIHRQTLLAPRVYERMRRLIKLAHAYVGYPFPAADVYARVRECLATSDLHRVPSAVGSLADQVDVFLPESSVYEH
jgi:hypothetical protein